MLPPNAETQEIWVLSLGWEDPLERIFWSGEEKQPTPVFLPGESHGQRSLVGYSSWSYKESDMTEHTQIHTRVRTHTHTHSHRACVVDPLHLYQPFSKVNFLLIP